MEFTFKYNKLSEIIQADLMKLKHQFILTMFIPVYCLYCYIYINQTSFFTLQYYSDECQEGMLYLSIKNVNIVVS